MDGWIHKTSRRRRMTASGDGRRSSLSTSPTSLEQTPWNQRPSYSALPSDLTWFCRYPSCPMIRAMPWRSRTARQHLQLPLLLHRLQQGNNIVSSLKYSHTVWKSGVRGDRFLPFLPFPSL